MLVKFTVYRSAEWVARERLGAGINVPESVKVDVEISQLSTASREVLLKLGCGSYLDWYDGLRVSQDWTLNRYGSEWSGGKFTVDAYIPTADEIDAEITAAMGRIESKRKTDEAERAERHRAEAEKKAKFAEAKTLLASELAERDNFKSRLSMLSEFLSKVPLDAINETAERIAAEGSASLLEELDDAADCWIVRNRNES